MNRSIVLLFSVLLFVACSKQQVEEVPSLLTISLSDKTYEIETIPADTLLASAKYIPLETNEEGLISEVHKIVIGKSIYLINKRYNELFVFDLNGEFLLKRTPGNGPGEFLHIDDIQLEEDLVYILDGGSKSILIYNSDLEFQRKVSLNENYCAFEMTDRFIYLYVGFQSYECKNMHVFDRKEGKIVNQYKPYPKEQLGVCPSLKSPLYLVGKELYATFPYEYSIYKLDEQGATKVMEVDFGSKNMVQESVRLQSIYEQDKYRWQVDDDLWPIMDIEDMRLTKTHLFFSFNYHCSTYTAVVNKKTSDYLVGYLMQTKKFPFVGPEISDWSNQSIVQVISTSSIMARKQAKNPIPLPVEFAAIEEESNPVIGIYRLKKQFR
jgi:hypothetical protein